jgi:hypothetical protein
MIAYTLHWLQISLHRNAVLRALATMNLRKDSVRDIDWRWYIPGLLLMALGGFWAGPMAAAGEAQRRYINTTSAAARAAMLQRVRGTNGQPLPSGPVINYTIHARRCDNGLCRATLPQGALFCPRCGTRSAMVA